MRKILLIASFIILSIGAKAQTGVLNIRLKADGNEQLRINVIYLKDSSVVYKEYHLTDTTIRLNNLEEGSYRIMVFNGAIRDRPFLNKVVFLKKGEYTVVELNVSLTIDPDNPTVSLDETETRFEIQFITSYMRSDWVNGSPYLINNFDLGITSNVWHVLTPHIGFLGGLGYGYSYHTISNDTSFTYAPQFVKSSEFYSYLHIPFDIKFRFSTGDQDDGFHSNPKLFLDLGAAYNFPVLFWHTVKYEGNRRTTTRRLHEFRDIRLYANLGYDWFAIFAEYRPLDFLTKNYPEIPRYNAGLKFMVH